MIPEWMLLADMTPQEREAYHRNGELVRQLNEAVARRHGAPR